MCFIFAERLPHYFEAFCLGTVSRPLPSGVDMAFIENTNPWAPPRPTLHSSSMSRNQTWNLCLQCLMFMVYNTVGLPAQEGPDKTPLS